MELGGLQSPCLGKAENETLVKEGKEGCGGSYRGSLGRKDKVDPAQLRSLGPPGDRGTLLQHSARLPGTGQGLYRSRAGTVA